MHLRLSFFLTVLFISAGAQDALSNSDLITPTFTIQVASFPDTAQASRFAAELIARGENAVCETVIIEGRGQWTRIFVGLFDTIEAARRYGGTLVGRGVIKEFLVKQAGPNQAVTRPRRVSSNDASVSRTTGSANSEAPAPVERAANSYCAPGSRDETINGAPAFSPRDLPDHAGIVLPVVQAAAFRSAPQFDTSSVPRPDPVSLAFKQVAGEVRGGPGALGRRGGLWISGDTAEVLERLRWIVGEENIGLIKLDADGRVRFDTKLLAESAGLREARVEDPLRAIDYISSNEGLLLLVQVAQGRYRYLLHIGRQAPTYGKNVETSGSINLDNNADSRINPYRKDGKKLDGERPPEGFDSLIALNPVARWFNLSTRSWVQSGEIVFHELAEAYAKLEFGLDYLDQGFRPGAHSRALEREQRMKSQRPDADIVLTTGSNRLLRTEEEIRLFYAEAAGISQR